MTFIVLVNFFLVICLNSSTQVLPDEFKMKSRSQQTDLQFAILLVVCRGAHSCHSENVVTHSIITGISVSLKKTPTQQTQHSETHTFEKNVTVGERDGFPLVPSIHGAQRATNKDTLVT